MLAFFLLMWLLSMTTPEQKQGLAAYFAPSHVSRSTSGAGGIMGGTAFDEEGARMPGTKPQVVMTISTPAQPKSPELAEKEAKDAAQMDKLMKEKSARDERNFRSAAESIRQAMRENPDLAELSRNVIIDETPEGLRIQIVDQDGRSMFPSGHAEPFERTRKLLDEVAGILIKLPNRVSISGHTDANPVAGRPGYSTYTPLTLPTISSA